MFQQGRSCGAADHPPATAALCREEPRRGGVLSHAPGDVLQAERSGSLSELPPNPHLQVRSSCSVAGQIQDFLRKELQFLRADDHPPSSCDTLSAGT